MPILTQKALLLAKIETTSGTDSVPTPGSNAIEVMEPAFTVDATVVERNFTRADFSQYRTSIGRKLASMTFTVEVRGGGTADQAPRWAPLLQACSFSSTAVAAGTAKTIAAPSTGAVRSGGITTLTFGAAHGFTVGDIITVAGVTDATFNGSFVVLSAPTTTTLTVANPGTNASSGNGTAVFAAGVKLKPITDNPSTITLYLYYEGLLHKITGAMGTFSFKAEAGKIATMEFTFTGNYIEPASTTYPTNAVFDATLAPMVELAQLTFNGSQTYVAATMEMEMANEVTPRQDMNSSNGFRNVRITGRNPTGKLDPEVEITYTLWNQMTTSTTTVLGAVIGSTAGNQIWISAPAVQLTGIEYGDRDGLRTYELAMAFRRGAVGDDELAFFFD